MLADRPIEFHRGPCLLTTDRRRIPREAALALLADTHWAQQIRAATFGRAMDHSVCFGMLLDGSLVGFARAVTDLATYAYWTDVVIASRHRGEGLGHWLVECMLAHPELQGFRRIALLTRDAQPLYAEFGFTTSLGPSTYMERAPGP